MSDPIICKNLSDMAIIAASFAKKIMPGQIITFEGPLGAGKTTFAQGLLKAWGYEGAVTSPTFGLVHEYKGLHANGHDFDVAHFDLYRLKNSSELEDIGFRDYLDDHTICLIEWPCRAQDYLPKADWHFILDHLENGRSIDVGLR